MKHINHIFSHMVKLVLCTLTLYMFYRMVSKWKPQIAQNAGHDLDIATNQAAHHMHNAAIGLNEWSMSGYGETLGKGIDEILLQTKQSLNEASDVVAAVLSRKSR